MIRHLVFFNLKQSATDADLAEIVRSAQQGLTRVPGVRNLAVSESLAASGQSSFRYALTMEFDDEVALAVYNDHPLHQEFRKVFAPRRENVQVLDFVALPDQS
ncbi:MAG: Dabb family protein [Chloroflexota bacterium]